jgi:hypothetical protein
MDGGTRDRGTEGCGVGDGRERDGATRRMEGWRAGGMEGGRDGGTKGLRDGWREGGNIGIWGDGGQGLDLPIATAMSGN